MAIFKKVKKGENKTFVLFGGWTESSPTTESKNYEDTESGLSVISITDDETSISVIKGSIGKDGSVNRVANVSCTGAITLTDNPDRLLGYKEEFIKHYGIADDENDYTSCEEVVIIKNVTESIQIKIWDVVNEQFIPDDVEINYDKCLGHPECIVGEYEFKDDLYHHDLEPIIVIPDTAIVEEIPCFNDITLGQIAVRMGVINRKAKIDIVMNIDRNKIKKVVDIILTDIGDGLYRHGVYNFTDKMPSYEYVNIEDIIDLGIPSIIEILRGILDIDIKESYEVGSNVYHFFSREGGSLRQSIVTDIIGCLYGLPEQDFEKILDSDSRFEY